MPGPCENFPCGYGLWDKVKVWIRYAILVGTNLVSPNSYGIGESMDHEGYGLGERRL